MKLISKLKFFLKKNYKINYSLKLKNIKKENIFRILLKTKISKSYVNLFKNVKLNSKYNYLYYSIDYYNALYYKEMILGNLTIDYNDILEFSLKDYENKISKISDKKMQDKFNDLINGIKILIDREVEFIDNIDIKESLEGIKYRNANSFKDALQRILFFNQLLWQTNHSLIGIGRLDLILDSYYKKDIKTKKVTKIEVNSLLEEFLKILHEDYYYKSASLAGDTGQIIILGGLTNKEEYFCNDLTYMLIDILKDLKEPDPKILLRVSEKMPKELLNKSIKCIATGIGCPLFANDDVIIPNLINFGYKKEDAYNYVTAACWEPFIASKSFDQSNMESIVFAEPLNSLLENENLNEIKDKNSLLNKYYEYLNNYLEEFKKKNDAKNFSKDILLSLFTKNCIKNEKDIANGGAIYNNYGFTSVGLSNTINSILSINKYVFDDKEYTLEKFNNIRKNNYIDNDIIVKKIKSINEKYGTDDEEIVNLTNEIIKKVSKYFENKINPLGGKYKFGLSSPGYINLALNFPASFDGRKDGEPFGVHISSDKSNGYTELINFASMLDYSDNRINGNVIDFFVTPNFIDNNFDKFSDFIYKSIKKGFYEMQMNVVSSKELIDAKSNPEKYPNLIVRVWGFSAYFNDLPEEYKNYLIERALKNEGNS